jgi:ferredoxin
MRITVNEARCEAYGFCEEKAPDLVALDDEGELEILVEDLDETQKEAAQQAVRSCPVAALTLVEPV